MTVDACEGCHEVPNLSLWQVAHLKTKLHDARRIPPSHHATYDVHGHKVRWSSRAHRLGRFARIEEKAGKLEIPPLRLWGWEFGNISWLVAEFFTMGSVCWCVNGYYAYSVPDNSDAIAYSAFAGGMLFWVGAYLAVLQAINREDFIAGTGYDLKRKVDNIEEGIANTTQATVRLLSGHHQRHSIMQRLKHPDTNTTTNPESSNGESKTSDMNGASDVENHASRANGESSDREVAPKESVPVSSNDGENGKGVTNGTKPPPVEPWTWSLFPPRGSCIWIETGYLSSIIQFCGATFFSLSVICGFPNVLPEPYDANYLYWNWLVWGPQLVGSVGFIVSSHMYIIETQEGKWKPKLTTLGWHVGFWNLLGAIFFFLCAAFGFLAYPNGCCQKYGTALSTYLGAWFFLLASYLQLVEVLNPHRVPPKRRFQLRNLLAIRFW